MKIPFVSLQKMHQEISLEMKNKFSEESEKYTENSYYICEPILKE